MVRESFKRLRLPKNPLIATESPKPFAGIKSFDFQCASPPEKLSATELYSYATKNYTRSSRIQQKEKKKYNELFHTLLFDGDFFSIVVFWCFRAVDSEKRRQIPIVWRAAVWWLLAFRYGNSCGVVVNVRAHTVFIFPSTWLGT